MKLLWVYERVDGFVIALQNNILETLKDMRVEFEVCHISGLKEAYKKLQPVATIFFHPFNLSEKDLLYIKKMNGHKILWSMEEPYEIDLTMKYYPYMYYCISQDKNSAEFLKSVFGKSVHIPHACNPKIHKKLDSVPFKYRSDLFFCGNAFPERIKFFEEVADFLKDYMVTIIGIGYNGMRGYENQNVLNIHISTEEMVKYINGAKVNLNIHRLHGMDMANKTKIKFSSPNNRLFEIASCGGYQLVDSTRKKEILEYLNGSINLFSDTEDFKKEFTIAINCLPNQRQDAGNNAREQVLKYHTYEHRLAEVLKILGKEAEKYQ